MVSKFLSPPSSCVSMATPTRRENLPKPIQYEACDRMMGGENVIAIAKSYNCSPEQVYATKRRPDVVQQVNLKRALDVVNEFARGFTQHNITVSQFSPSVEALVDKLSSSDNRMCYSFFLFFLIFLFSYPLFFLFSYSSSHFNIHADPRQSEPLSGTSKYLNHSSSLYSLFDPSK